MQKHCQQISRQKHCIVLVQPVSLTYFLKMEIGWSLQSCLLFRIKVLVFGPFLWPHLWVYQKFPVIQFWGNILDYNIFKGQGHNIRTVASRLKEVHFWDPIWGTPLVWWNRSSPKTRPFLNQSQQDLVCQSTLGSCWLIPNLIQIGWEMSEL